MAAEHTTAPRWPGSAGRAVQENHETARWPQQPFQPDAGIDRTAWTNGVPATSACTTQVSAAGTAPSPHA